MAKAKREASLLHHRAFQPKLGGLRGKSKTIARGVNDFWTNESFHNYADYALSDEFRAGLDRLIEDGRSRRSAMMCSEAVWWRCHRRIVADHLIARGESVFHIMGKNRLESARLTAGAVVQPGGTVVYPGASVPDSGLDTITSIRGKK